MILASSDHGRSANTDVQFRRFSLDYSRNLIRMKLDRLRGRLELVHDDGDDFAPELLRQK